MYWRSWLTDCPPLTADGCHMVAVLAYGLTAFTRHGLARLLVCGSQTPFGSRTPDRLFFLILVVLHFWCIRLTMRRLYKK